MSIHIIKVPDIGEGVAEVEIIKWYVQVGDEVAEDQGLVDIMTDKAAVEIPSPLRGKVIQTNAKEGEVVAVGSVLLRIDTEEETSAQAGGGLQAVSPVAAQSGPLVTAQAGRSTQQAPPESVAEAGAEAKLHFVADTGKAHNDGNPGKPLASPSVRQQARQAGIALADVQGSGPGGRVTHADLDALAQAGPGRRLSVPGEEGARVIGGRAPDGGGGKVSNPALGTERFESDKGVAMPVIGLRRRIAQNMQQAVQHIPHFSYVEEVDVTELEGLRARLNSAWEHERGHLTLLPFVLRAMALAVRDYPQVNALYDDAAQTLTHYAAVHAGVATQTAAGLVVPVVRHVEGRNLWSCAAEIARMGEQARAGKIAREDLGGSTIGLTSLGALGGIVSTPIINYPQVAIVGLNKIAQRPVVVAGSIAVRKIMNVSSSFDHRIIDGAYAAGFIQAVRGYLECPATLFIE